MRHAAPLCCVSLAFALASMAACQSAPNPEVQATLASWRPTVPLKSTPSGAVRPGGATHGASIISSPFGSATGAAGTAARSVVDATDATFDRELAAAGDAACINFTAKWCAPCKAMAPTLDQLAAEQNGRLKVIRVDFDECPATVRRYGISALPALLMVRNGVVVKRIVGYQSRENLARSVASVVP